MLIITSKKAGFRRCGVAHPAESTEYPDGFFTPEQIEELHKEPMLVVKEGEEEASELSNKSVPARQLVALVKQATVEDLEKLAEGETRKQVLEAIDARRKELA